MCKLFTCPIRLVSALNIRRDEQLRNNDCRKRRGRGAGGRAYGWNRGRFRGMIAPSCRRASLFVRLPVGNRTEYVTAITPKFEITQARKDLNTYISTHKTGHTHTSFAPLLVENTARVDGWTEV